MNNNTLPQIYLKWKFLCAYLCQNWQYFCNSDIRIIFGHQKGVDCTFFGVFRELLGGTAKFWGSKMKILLFLEIGLCQSCHLPPKTSFLQYQTCRVIFAGAKIGSPNFPKQVGFVCLRLQSVFSGAIDTVPREFGSSHITCGSFSRSRLSQTRLCMAFVRSEQTKRCTQTYQFTCQPYTQEEIVIRKGKLSIQPYQMCI